MHDLPTISADWRSAFPVAVESAHMNHPDFRVGKKIFATLGYPDNAWAMVKLTPEEQQNFLDAAPEVFSPVTGGWGRQARRWSALKWPGKP